MIDYVGFIENSDVLPTSNKDFAVTIYRSCDKVKIFIPKTRFINKGFFVRAGDTLLDSKSNLILSSLYNNNDNNSASEDESKTCHRYVNNGRNEIKMVNSISFQNSKEIQKLAYNSLSTFQYYYRAEKYNYSGRKKNISSGLYIVRATEDENCSIAFDTMFIKNSLGEGVFNILNSSKFSYMINTNFDFIILMFYYLKNAMSSKEEISSNSLTNFNFFLFFVDLDKLIPTTILKEYITSSKLNANVKAIISNVNSNLFNSCQYGLEKIVLLNKHKRMETERKCRNAIRQSQKQNNNYDDESCGKHKNDYTNGQQQFFLFGRCASCFFEAINSASEVVDSKKCLNIDEKIINKLMNEENECLERQKIKSCFQTLENINEINVISKMKSYLSANVDIDKLCDDFDETELVVIEYFIKSFDFITNIETSNESRYLNFLLMSLINSPSLTNFTMIFPYLNSFGKMIMLDMLNATIITEPTFDKNESKITNFKGCSDFWSYSLRESNMTKKFQIYKWIFNDSSDPKLPFNMSNAVKVPMVWNENDEINLANSDFKSYQAYAKMYMKNTDNPVRYFEEIYTLKSMYNNTNFSENFCQEPTSSLLCKPLSRFIFTDEIREKLIGADIVDYFSSPSDFGINNDRITNNILNYDNASVRTGSTIYTIEETIPPDLKRSKILCFVKQENQEILLKSQKKLRVSFFDTETTGLNATKDVLYSLATCSRSIASKNIDEIVLFAICPEGISTNELNKKLKTNCLNLLQKKNSLYAGASKNWHARLFKTEREMLEQIDAYYAGDSKNTIFSYPSTYIVGFNLPFDLAFLVVRMIMNKVDSKLFQFSKLTENQKLHILDAYIASTQFSEYNVAGNKNMNFMLKLLRSVVVPHVCYFDMMQMVKLKFTNLSSYNLNACVEAVCGKSQAALEQKIIIDVADLLNYFRIKDVEKIAYIHSYCIHDAALVSLLESSMGTIMEHSLLGELNGETFDTLLGWASKNSKIVYSCFTKHVQNNGGKHQLVSVTGSYERHNNRNCPTKGGLVITPVQMSILRNVLITLDFASLYPSIMITNNCCYASVVAHGQIVRSVKDKMNTQMTTTPALDENIDFDRYSKICTRILDNWIPLNIVVDNWNQEVDEFKEKKHLGVEYFPSFLVPCSIEKRAYWREDYQVEPTGLNHFFPALFDICEEIANNKHDVLLQATLNNLFYPYVDIISNVYELGKFISKLLIRKNITTLNDAQSLHEDLNGANGKDKIKSALLDLYVNPTRSDKIKLFVREISARFWNCGAYTRIWIPRRELLPGALPDLQRMFGEKRTSLKRQANDETLDPYDRRLADINQNITKCMMNSIYGIMSSELCPNTYNKLLSNMITQIGRRNEANINIAANELIDGVVNVYGDTDSTFLTFQMPSFERKICKCKKYIYVDLKLEHEACQFLENNISQTLKGISRFDSDYFISGRNVMKLVPERVVLFGFIYMKKSYVLCHFKESSPTFLKILNDVYEEDEVSSSEFYIRDEHSTEFCKNNEMDDSSDLPYSVVVNPNWSVINEKSNSHKISASTSRYLLRLNIKSLINFYLSNVFVNENNKDFAKFMMESNNDNNSFHLEKNSEMCSSFLQIYRKGIFAKGDVNDIELKLHFIAHICLMFKDCVKKNLILEDLINSSLHFDNTFSKMSTYNKCSKKCEKSNIYQALINYNEKTHKDFKIFPDLLMGVKSKYANMLSIDIISDSAACSSFINNQWFNRTMQEKKTWSELRGMGTLSGCSILNKSAIVNVFIMVRDGIQKFTLNFENVIYERLEMCVNKNDFTGLCFLENYAQNICLKKVNEKLDKVLKLIENASNDASAMNILKDHLNCSSVIAKELYYAIDFLLFLKNLCVMLNPDSAFMYCSSEKCTLRHDLMKEKRIRIDCEKQKKAIRFQKRNDFLSAFNICKMLKNFTIPLEKLVEDLCNNVIDKHIKCCDIFLGFTWREKCKNFFNLCWGRARCRDVCEFTLDTHMYLVLLYIQTVNVPQNSNWFNDSYKFAVDIFNSEIESFESEIQTILEEFSQFRGGDLVYRSDDSKRPREEDDVNIPNKKIKINGEDNNSLEILRLRMKQFFKTGTIKLKNTTTSNNNDNNQIVIKRGIYNGDFVRKLTIILIKRIFKTLK